MSNERWAILISGRGSNMVRMIDSMSVDVGLVLTSDRNASGCARAVRRGIRVEPFPKKLAESGRAALDWGGVDSLLKPAKISRIFLLGFMRIVPATFLEKWAGRVLNLHPSLLPLYPGLNSIEKAFVAGDRIGATVHEVVPTVDAGPIVLSRPAVEFHDDVPALADVERLVHIEEQRMVERVLRKRVRGPW
ncbi:MAG: phosphoribosylglycinamide formyltransferase [Bdellovibrionales bacterium]|nr:phosphoribosylglycinamide formyltransferase [Bdellovibrionales bacterium]